MTATSTVTDTYSVADIASVFRDIGTDLNIEPQFHAPNIAARVLVAAGDNNAVNGPEWLTGLVDAFDGETTVYQLTHEGQRDHDAMEAWLAEAQGVEPRPRIWEIER